MGTIRTMPFRRARGRLWGPGVLDMKAGLAFFLYAMRALIELDIPVTREIVLLVNPDEETGSHSSRATTESLAKQSDAVIVVEPGTGLEGNAKTSRKGTGLWTLKVGASPPTRVSILKKDRALCWNSRARSRLLPASRI